MRRPREGHDRGRWLLFVPPQPLELVARPDFGRPVALCVRRDGLPAEGLAARAAYGRGVDVRGVRRDPGRTPGLYRRGRWHAVGISEAVFRDGATRRGV